MITKKFSRLILGLSALIWACLIAQFSASAFADTFFGTYHSSRSYGPNSDQIYGSNYTDCCTSGYRAIQAGQYGLSWDSSRLSALQAKSDVGPVVHLFRYVTSNCEARFDYDGYSEGYPGYSLISKEAGCFNDSVSGHKNEVRIYWNVSLISSSNNYFGAAEFRGTNYPPATEVGKVSNDIYYNPTSATPDKENTSITWCFTNSGSAYAC